ncbi:M20/M25/M40 family metallo-hydrolase, partial [Candidatus Bathyarchaeota archaeon]|nr:M20/M25/M40 family metallo-hydrolase [Candidatus Bathyarchaeota archaeon]
MMRMEALSRIDEAYCRRLLEEMVSIPSVVGEEKELAEYVASELEALGLKPELQVVEEDRPNVIALWDSGKPGRMLMLNGHLDTVPVCEGWSTDPFKPVVKGDRLYGLGALDMKGGLACLLTALKAIVEAEPDIAGSIAYTAVVGEEAYSKGAKALLKTHVARADAVIIGEPYSGYGAGAIPLGITGKILYNIVVKGKAAHAFRPEEGINAIEEAARIIANLHKLRLMEHPKFGRGNLCTLKIEGGYKVYSVVVPDHCRFEVNRLLVPGETVSSAIEGMRQLVESLSLRAEVEVGTKPPRYEAFEMSPDEPIIKAFTEAF